MNGHSMARVIVPQWNKGLIIASIAISLLGAFTSTQLMCQARTSRYLSGVLVWTALSSLTFGFCSIFSLHFVAMLACELDLSIGLNVPLTILSAILAVFFTFIALSSDQVIKRWRRQRRKRLMDRRREERRHMSDDRVRRMSEVNGETDDLLSPSQREMDENAFFEELSPGSELPPMAANGNAHITKAPLKASAEPPFPAQTSHTIDFPANSPQERQDSSSRPPFLDRQLSGDTTDDAEFDQDVDDTATSDALSENYTGSRRSSGVTSSDASTFGLGKFNSFKPVKSNKVTSRNPFVSTGLTLWAGLTMNNVAKGFFWSLAITSMHYVGILALKIPQGRCTLHPLLVVLSGLISWIVCSVASILMAQMETHFAQQLLFSVVAASGVAAMHFTGMAAATFWSDLPPSQKRGYPPGLAIAIASIAIATCLAANGLLAHSATVARNKLAEIVHTRKKLWAAIAQKENAEAAAMARSEFIASASHEIRTPLHQLQGYSDLLSRTRLTEEGRLLLFAIQDATRTLSLITSNVLDWSRLEKGEAISRPTALDVRMVCESVMHLLPNKDDEVDMELLVAVAPEVPRSLFIDETYLSRIIMNLLSNAIKFTASGYVVLRIYLKGDDLVFTVTDSGCGIPESFLPELFEPFKQAQTRGAHRGTGLGLSIVKQLLHKMDGEIQLESKYRDTEGVGPERSGTTFTITMPVQSGESSQTPCPPPTGRLAYFPNQNSRLAEGLRLAWEIFGVELVEVESSTDLSPTFKYVWVEAERLKRDKVLLRRLKDQDDWIVLVLYESDTILSQIFGKSTPPQFVSLRAPLVWHKILKSIEGSGQRPTKIEPPSRMVRFASKVDVLEAIDSTGSSTVNRAAEDSSPVEKGGQEPGAEAEAETETEREPPTVLLVEDNKINQKLGAKMLKTLGYNVAVADDGQEAIEIVMLHDETIDAILMDQSMPRKDGLTATREIREMEKNGRLKGPTRLKSHRPIIAVTAVVGPKVEAMCKEAGTDAFLAKPLSLGRLKESLEWFLSEENQV